MKKRTLQTLFWLLLGGLAAYGQSAPVTVCSSGCQFTSIQAAHDDVKTVAGTVISVKGDFNQSASGGNLVTLSKKGVVLHCVGAHLRGRRTVPDDYMGEGSSGVGSDRAVVVSVAGDDVTVEGCLVTHSNTAGIEVSGNNAVIQFNTVTLNWLTGIGVRSGSGSTVRFNEVYGNLHGSGIGGGSRNLKGSTIRVDRLSILYNLIHDNGYLPNGSKVPPIPGDPAGGGNSDGTGSSKSCAKNTPGSNTCFGWVFKGNVGYHNADDFMDNSAEGYEVTDNFGYCNGPNGGRAIKVLNPTSGNLWANNVAWSAGCAPDSKDHGIELEATSGAKSVARNNVGINYTTGGKPDGHGVILGANVSDGGGNREMQTGAAFNSTIPAGSIYSRLKFAYDQARALAFELPPLPDDPGGPGPLPSPTPTPTPSPSPTPGSGDFTLSLAPFTQTVAPGGTTTFGVVVERTNFTAPVTLTTASTQTVFSPNPVVGASSTLTVAVPASTPTGTYVFKVTGVGGGVTKTASGQLVVAKDTPRLCCPAGWTLEGSNCTRTTVETQPATTCSN